MKLHEIELWALRVIERVKAGQPVEDSRVELKSGWIPPERAARRIAGHANAARGEPILWLIGVDEAEGPTGADDTEQSEWWGRVRSEFDGLAPELLSLNVPADDKTVVAMMFSTDHVPFVVRNAQFGRQGGGPVEREVPWREGTAVRSATRSDLLRLLMPLTRLPDCEVLGGELVARRVAEPDGGANEWHLRLPLYITPRDQTTLAIPFHRCTAWLRIQEPHRRVNLEKVEIHPTPEGPLIFRPVEGHVLGPPAPRTQTTIDGPGPYTVSARAVEATASVSVGDVAEVHVSLRPAGAEDSRIIEATLTRVSGGADEIGRWAYHPQR